MALQRLGYKVLAAANGNEALRLFEQPSTPPVQLLLTDVIMPQMSGKELANRVKARQPGLKVLFTSGYTDDILDSHGVLHGEVDLLPKPCDSTTLARRIRGVLDSDVPPTSLSGPPEH